MNMTKYEQIEYFRRRVGHLFVFKSGRKPCILRGGFATNIGFALVFETIGWRGHVCSRTNFSLFGQISDNEMRERKFFYAFPDQVMEITND